MVNLDIQHVLTLNGLKKIYKEWEEEKKARLGAYVGAEGLLNWYNTFEGKQRSVSIEDQLVEAKERKIIQEEDGTEDLFDYLDADFEDSIFRYNQYAYEQEEVWIIHKFPYDFITQPPLSYYKKHKDYKVKIK